MVMMAMMVMMVMMSRKAMIRIVGSQVDDDLVRSVHALERLGAQQYKGRFLLRPWEGLYLHFTERQRQIISEHPYISRPPLEARHPLVQQRQC